MNSFLEWVPMASLAAISFACAYVAIRLRLPWFVGAPLSGLVAITIFEAIGIFILREQEKLLYVALVFGALYGMAFALVVFAIAGMIRRIRRID